MVAYISQPSSHMAATSGLMTQTSTQTGCSARCCWVFVFSLLVHWHPQSYIMGIIPCVLICEGGCENHAEGNEQSDCRVLASGLKASRPNQRALLMRHTRTHTVVAL